MGMNNIEAILGCRKAFNLTPSEFLFLWYLAFKGNDEDRDFAVRGEAWPGHLTIKAEIGLDSETVRCASKRMTGLKILTIHDPGYKDRNSTTYIVDYTRFEAPLDSRPHPPQIEAPHPSDSGVPPLELSTPTPQIEGRTGIQQEQKKNVNGNEQEQRSSVSPFVSKPETSGETPEPPDEDYEEKLKWAKGETPYPCWIGWKKFTTNPKSFKTACLESETFNNSFADRKKKTPKSSNRSDLHKAAYGIPRNEEEAAKMVSFLNPSKEVLAARTAEDLERQKQKAEEKRRYDAPRTCAHCKVVFKEFLRDGYCADHIQHHLDWQLHWYYCKCDLCLPHKMDRVRKEATV